MRLDERRVRGRGARSPTATRATAPTRPRRCAGRTCRRDAKSLALICDDPDAPRGTWVHWVLFDLSPSAGRRFPSGVPKADRPTCGGVQGRNDYGDVGWGGPQPPRGHGVHHYEFRLSALDTLLGPAAGCDEGAGRGGHARPRPRAGRDHRNVSPRLTRRAPARAPGAARARQFLAIQREVVACRRCPRLVAWREQAAATPAAPLSPDRSTGPVRSRRSAIRARAHPDRRPRPRRARRKSHRPDVHGRRVRQTSSSRLCTRSGLANQPDSTGRRRRARASPARFSRRRAAALRPTTGRLPRSSTIAADTSRARLALLPPAARLRGARRARLRRLPASPVRRGSRRSEAPAALRARRRSTLGEDRLVGDVSPEPAEHLHREADAADAAGRVPSDQNRAERRAGLGSAADPELLAASGRSVRSAGGRDPTPAARVGNACWGVSRASKGSLARSG